MLFQRINRSSPEKIFVVVKNGYSTAALSNGQAVNWDFITAVDGVSVTLPLARNTSGGFACAGVIASSTIAIADFGLVQVYGLHSSARTREITGGIPALTKGVPLAVNAAGSVFCLENLSTGFTGLKTFPVGFAMQANSSWTTVATKVFIKAL